MFRSLAFLPLALLLIVSVVPGLAGAAETYQSAEDYLQEVFGQPPQPQSLWLTGELGDEVTAILTHKPRRLRERYWAAGNRSVWIMEEIGKERPITMGFTVENGVLKDARVLVYRESRGWEIRLPRFREQFTGARLEGSHELDRNIDGITGATLSVHAMQRLARVALLLHSKISESVVTSQVHDTPEP